MLVIYNIYIYILQTKTICQYLYINITNISNMHHIADIAIKIHSTFIKLVRSHVIRYYNVVFQWNYIVYKLKHNYQYQMGKLVQSKS